MDGLNFATESGRRVRVRPAKRGNNVLEAQLANTPALARIAYRIRYEAYHAYGFVSERKDLLFSDVYDTMANCQTILVFRNGVPAGTIRVALYDPGRPNRDFHRIQAMEIFGSEIRAALGTMKRPGTAGSAVEIGKLARAADATNDVEVLFALFRAAGYMILHHDIDVVFNAVRAHHMPMYRRFGFQQLEAPRLYPGLTFRTGLMACFHEQYDTARECLPFLDGISPRDEVYAGLLAGERVCLSAPGETAAHDMTAGRDGAEVARLSPFLAARALDRLRLSA